MKTTTNSIRQSILVWQLFRGIGPVTFLILLAATSQATTLTWTGGSVSSGNWSDSANWGSIGVPASGDTLIFPAGSSRLTNTNNLSSLALNQILFTGASGGYNLYGNSFSITNSIQATNSAGANTINNSVTLSTADITVLVSNGASLNMNGQIAGTVGLTKTGLGTLTYQYSGSNPYTGTTRVNAGLLQLNVGGVSAFGGALVIGDGSGTGSPTARLLQSSDISDSAAITVNQGGLLDLNGYSDVIGSLTMQGGTAASGSGTLYLNGDLTTLASSVSATITGKLAFNNSLLHTVSVADGGVFYDLNLLANVTDAGGGIMFTNIVAGASWARLTGSNNITGPIIANNLTVAAESGNALGVTNDITIGGNGTLWLYSSTFTNQMLWLQPGANVTAQNTCTWGGSAYLYGNATIYLFTSGSDLTITGAVQGIGGFTKTGSGSLTLGGQLSNNYMGQTTVVDGTLNLSKPLGHRATGSGLVTIGDGSGSGGSAIVRAFGNYGIGSASVMINSDGLLDLNGYNDTIAPALTLNNGTIQTGAGTLQLSEIAITNSGNSSIYGNLAVNTSTCRIQGSGWLLTYANIGGSANIIKNENVCLWLFGSNTFTGTLTANNSGYLYLGNNNALGGTNGGTVVNDSTFIYLSQGINITNESLTLNSSYVPAISIYPNTTNRWVTTNITVSANEYIFVDTNSLLELNGPIMGSGGITKQGPGRLMYSGTSANTYSGLTSVNEGELDLAKSGAPVYAIPSGGAGLMIGDGVGTDVVRNFAGTQIWGAAPVTITNSGIWDLNGYTDGGDPLTLNGGQLTTGSGACAMINTVKVGADSTVSGKVRLDTANVVFSNTSPSSLNMNASIYGFSTSQGIAKAGNGHIYLNASNSYGGLTVVREGFLHLGNNWALGATGNGTVVSNGASLVLDGNVCITNEALTLSGPGPVNWGSLDVESGIHTWAGPITNNANSTLDAWSSSSELHISGPISGPGGLELFNAGLVGGTGIIYYEGGAANTYAGLTTVDAYCTLVLAKSIDNGAITGDLSIYGTVRYGPGNYQIADNASVTVQNGFLSGGLLDLNLHNDMFDALAGNGQVIISGAWLVVNANHSTSAFDGVISGVGTLYKYGNGTLTLNGNNTLTGGTTVTTGTLLVNGSQPQSPVTISSGATLGGHGMVGPITANGNVAPGNSPGILNSSNVTFAAGGNLTVALNGADVGTGYSQLNVTGTVTLTSATLKPVAATAGAVNNQYTIINNDGADAVTGTFAGLPEGAAVAGINGLRYTISYHGGSGNDVVLTQTNLPNPPGLVGIQRLAGGSMQLRANGLSNLTYTVWASTNLAPVNWSSIGSVTVPGYTNVIQFTDPDAANYRERFYRFSWP